MRIDDLFRLMPLLAPDDGGDSGAAGGDDDAGGKGGDGDGDGGTKSLATGGDDDAGDKDGAGKSLASPDKSDDAGDGSGSKDQDGAGVPEKYEFKVPEGQKLDEAAVKEATEVFRDLGLTNEQAQKLIDLDFKRQAASAKAFKEQTETWVKEVKDDPDVGRDKFNATISKVQAVVKKFGDGDLVDMLDHYGIGNHLSVIKFISRIASALGEDTREEHEVGGGKAEEKTAEEVLYGTVDKGVPAG